MSICEEGLLDLIEGKLQDRESRKKLLLEPVVYRVVHESIEQLRNCPEFTDALRESLEPIVTSTILFLARCMDIQEGGAGKRTAYLFNPNAKESDLQDDLMDWYKGNLHGDPFIEAQHLGGGRVEIVFPIDGIRFAVELKREKSDSSKESLNRYMAQTASYQSTTIPVAMLVVLDLTSRGNLTHIRENVWVEPIRPHLTRGMTWYVIVVRIPGNRVAPSKRRSTTTIDPVQN
ncbi:MAG: hypothetical protein OXG77_00115 [Chloroflexi bacterium]|nr:hypothetical protein [Chloroflexota bacterium]